MKRRPEQVKIMEQQGYLATEEVAKRTGYTTSAIVRLLSDKKVEGVKFGNGWWVKVESMRAKLGGAAFLLDAPAKAAVSK